MFERIRVIYENQGVSEQWLDILSGATGLALLLLVSIVVHLVLKTLITRAVTVVVRRSPFRWDDAALDAGVLRWLAHLIPASLIFRFAPEVMAHGKAVEAVQMLAAFYIIIASVLVLFALLTGAHNLYEEHPVSQDLPVTSFVQVLKLLVVLLAVIFTLSILIGKSPVVLLSGLGALTAILLLIFKDAILGFVAGIQLSANRMMAKGDWIEMPKYGANGVVEELALTTVKVRNWDMTRTTIPSYALISDSFINWKGMEESGGRRIQRSIYFDVNSIRLVDEEMLKRFEKIKLIKPYLDGKKAEIEEWNREHGVKHLTETVNARRLTNIGTFRAYVLAYLNEHPQVNTDMMVMARQLQSSDRGLPLEVYCFIRDKRWFYYEGIQADIFDHLFAVAAEFDLRMFQFPTGAAGASSTAVAGAVTSE